MPEYPDVTVYLESLAPRVLGQPLEGVRVRGPALVRTADPPLREATGRRVTALRRQGKRLIFVLEDDLFLVLHLMIAGRLHWKARGTPVPGRVGLAAFDFPTGTLTLTEASPKKRAQLWLLRGEDAVRALDRGGIDPMESTLDQFAAALRKENHTLKRALTDPRLFSGIGNAYSDEILHAARLSPVALSQRLDDDEVRRLYESTRTVLRTWTDRLRAEAGGGFPEKVTAFREGMAVHGRYRKPCPDCGSPVQRIVHADNEPNYCPTCQTGGRLLADRSLSRLLKEDWPRSLEEMEESRAATRSRMQGSGQA
ncbi:MAG TPA: DNA-formamidopyrimidine glycosylase family protein [Myxococcaceae bacterium]|nr:DNA-formamidopyrimidine glycosylase family protein [Myxococcaceae bacterium]